MHNSAERGQPPSEHLVAAVLDVDADRCTNQIVQLATITLLIDAGLITAGQAIERVEALKGLLAHEHLAKDIDARIGRMVAWVRNGPRPERPRWRPSIICGGLGADQGASD